MRVGRPKKTGNQICPICKKQGFSYTNTVKVSNSSSYFYIRFRHNESTLKDHDIDTIVKEKEPLKYATEYNRTSNQVTSFDFNRYLSNMKYYPIKHFNQNQPMPIIIYHVNEKSIPSQLNNELKKIAITEKEKDWILNTEPVRTQFRVNQFYNEILNSGIVTFGEKAVEYGEKINETEFIGNVSYQIDKFGRLGEVLKIREKSQTLSKSCDTRSNYPQRTLPELI